MTNYTTVLDATLQADKPATEATARALRDNPLAIAEGDASAPRNQIKSIAAPYFRAYRSTDQNASPNSSQWVKLQCATEVYDPDSLYDSVTNFRFAPNKPGLYLVSGLVKVVNGLTSSTNYAFGFGINGSNPALEYADYLRPYKSGGSNGADTVVQHQAIYQMNGTTDYIEAFWCQIGNAAQSMDVRGAFWAVGLCEI